MKRHFATNPHRSASPSTARLIVDESSRGRNLFQKFALALTCSALLVPAGCNKQDSAEFKEFDRSELTSLNEADERKTPAKSDSAAVPEQPAAALLASETKPSQALPTEQKNSDEQEKTASIAKMEAEKQPNSQANSSQSPEPSNGQVTSNSQQPLEMAKLTAAEKSGQMPTPGARLPGDPLVPPEPRTPKLLIPEKNFSAEGPEMALRVTFDDIDLLKVLNMEPVPEDAVEMFPQWLKDLEGKRVLIRGFMFPTLSQTGITYFQHVRDNEICCFGRTPKVYDRISTILKTGKTTRYIQGRPFDVIGTLRLDPVYDEGEWLQLYVLEDAVVME